MKILYPLIFALAPVATHAATITLGTADLTAYETTVEGGFGYQISLDDLDIVSVASITLFDDAQGDTFQLDAFGVGMESNDIISPDNVLSIPFDPVGIAGGTLEFSDGNFFQMASGGLISGTFGRPLVETAGEFLFIDAANAQRLGTVVIVGDLAPVPLPAGGLLLAGALGLFGLRRRLS